MDPAKTLLNPKLQTHTPNYVKILDESMEHNGFKYKLGLNTDHIPFVTGYLQPGGLCFTDLDNF